jgi:hypothetical protein
MTSDWPAQIAAAVAYVDAIPPGRTWFGPFNAKIADLMKAAKTEAERRDVEVAATALFARRNRTREYGEGQLRNILAEAERLAGPLPSNGLTSRGSAKPRTNGHDPKERELDKPLPPELAGASPRSDGSANPDVARILTAVRDALRTADNDNLRPLAVRDGAEAIGNIGANGITFDRLRDDAVAYGMREADIKNAIDQGIEMARVARTFGTPDSWAEESGSDIPVAEVQKADPEPEAKPKPRDPNDILREHGEAAVRDMLDDAVVIGGGDQVKSDDGAPSKNKTNRNAAVIAAALAGIKTATTLQTMKFPLLKYVVPGLIVEGCVLLAGKPKAGKSWFSYDVALAVASGRFCLGDKKCEQGSVLYLALEDNDRRLQSRATKLLPTFAGVWPERFNFQTQWPRANEGGIEAIDQWCEAHPDARLVVIDVLAAFREPSTNKTNAYDQDYAAVSQLQKLAARRAITIIIVHHTRKGRFRGPGRGD